MTQSHCHPEQSKDPMFADIGIGIDMNFRVAVRFFDEHNLEYHQGPSREAAKECSPRRKPWDKEAVVCQPRRGERNCLLEPSVHRATSK